MPTKEPNHICKNNKCPYGINGQPKHYYACDYCDRTERWHSMVCCQACLQPYQEQVIEERAKKKKVNLLPVRTDMTMEQTEELMHRPIEEIIEENKEEFKEFYQEGYSLANALEIINAEIDEKRKNDLSYSSSFNNGSFVDDTVSDAGNIETGTETEASDINDHKAKKAKKRKNPKYIPTDEKTIENIISTNYEVNKDNV